MFLLLGNGLVIIELVVILNDTDSVMRCKTGCYWISCHSEWHSFCYEVLGWLLLNYLSFSQLVWHDKICTHFEDPQNRGMKLAKYATQMSKSESALKQAELFWKFAKNVGNSMSGGRDL